MIKVKSFNLAAGIVNTWRWEVRLEIYPNGTLKNRGHISLHLKEDKEIIKERNQKYWIENKKELLAKNKFHRICNKEKISIQRQEYWKRKGRFKRRKWSLTENGRKSSLISYRRHSAKRRALNFISINNYFHDSEAHHIDKYFVIYIPRELHHNIPHNVWTGKNMKIINDLAFRWLRDNYKKDISNSHYTDKSI